MKKISIIILCIAMALLFAVVSPLQLAAGSKEQYISELKLAYGTEERDALAADGYTVLKDNLNDGNTVEVYLCYKTTGNKNEAIYDISMMNMTGNYSFAQFESMLASKKEQVSSTVGKLQTAIKEFAANYQANVTAAQSAYKTLNLFTDDDSGKGLGDLFVDGITDDQLITILVQANTNLLSTVYAAVSLGCSRNADGKSLLDLVQTENIDDDYSEELYQVCATVLEQLEEMSEDIELFNTTWEAAMAEGTANGALNNADMTPEKYFDEYLSKLDADNDTLSTIVSAYCLYKATSKVNYAQSEMSVFDLISTNTEVIKAEDDITVYYLAPLADALTAGQFAILECVGLNCVLSQSALDSDGAEKAYTDVADTVKDTGTDTISVFYGVDRTIYQGGKVALTTDASTESFANENYSWTDTTQKSIATAKTVQKIAQIAMVAIAGWTVLCLTTLLLFEVFANGGLLGTIGESIAEYFTVRFLVSNIAESGRSVLMAGISGFPLLMLFIAAGLVCLGAFIARLCYQKYSQKVVVDYTYTDIPEIIVDFTEDDSLQGEYVFYYAVTKSDGTPADLNGWDNKTNKYWNALYVSYDSRLGDPITEGFLVSSSAEAKDGMLGVHDFEKGVEDVKSAVNLNQSSKAQDTGVYLYYGTATNTQTGSVFSTGSGIAAIVGAFVLGLAISGGVAYAMTKKKKAEEAA